MENKPHWLVTELAAICAVGLILYIGWSWQKSTGLEGLKDSAEYHRQQSDNKGAIPIYERLLEGWKSARKPENKEYAEHLANLGNCYFDTDQDKKAEAILEKALALREKLLKPDSVQLGDTMRRLAYCFAEDKKYEQSVALYKRAIEIFDKARYRSDLILSLDGLAFVYYAQGKYEDALPYYEREVRINGSSIDKEDQCSAAANLGLCYYNLRKYDKAEPHLKNVVHYRLVHQPEGDVPMCSAYQNLYDCLRAEGKQDEVKELETEAAFHKCSLRL